LSAVIVAKDKTEDGELIVREVLKHRGAVLVETTPASETPGKLGIR
jgi:hypothetical protein